MFNLSIFVMMFFKNKILIVTTLLFSCILFSQGTNSRKYLVKGNKEYLRLSYDEAAANYLRAIQEGDNSYKVNFNFGNTMFRMKKYEEAISQYKKSAKLAATKTEEADAYFNIGDSYYKKKEYEQAAEAFKKSLKLNPKDDKARYNYALAKQKLKEQNDNKKGKNKDNSQNNSKQDQKGNQKQNDQQENQENQNQNSQQDNNQQGKSGGNGEDEKTGQGSGQRQGNQKINNTNSRPNEKLQGTQNLAGQRQFYDGILGSMEEQEKRAQQKIINKKIPQSQSNRGKDW